MSLLHFEAGANMQVIAMGGGELLVLEGEVSEQSDVLVKHSWLRLPINTDLNITAGNQGAKVWLYL
ncbi:cupin, partial [Pseudoalteromonas carrageenovora]